MDFFLNFFEIFQLRTQSGMLDFLFKIPGFTYNSPRVFSRENSPGLET